MEHALYRDTKVADRLVTVLADLSVRDELLDHYLEKVCDATRELLGAGLVAVTLYRDGAKYVLALRPGEADAGQAYRVHGELSTHVVNSRMPLCVADARRTTEYGAAPDGYVSYLGMPLTDRAGEVLGSLCYFDEAARDYSSDEVALAKILADRAAIAIDNYQLYQILLQHKATLEQQVAERTQQLVSAQQRIVEQERLAAIGEFSSQLVHEIRNPLSTIQLSLGYLAGAGLAPAAAQRVALAHNETARLTRLLSDTLLYARPPQLRCQRVDLNDFIRAAITSAGPLFEARTQQLLLQLHPGALPVAIDGDRVAQVVANLARNAAEAAPAASTVVWRTGAAADHGGGVFFSVTNSGEPVAAALLERIGTPFFTTKADGTGLGLAIANGIVTAHGGALTVTSDARCGTTVTVTLPRINA